MRRLFFAAIPVVMLACSGGSFDVANTQDATADDTGVSGSDTGAPPADAADDTGTATNDTGVSILDGGGVDVSPVDTAVLADSGCPAVSGTSTDIYVDPNAAPGGTGSSACPFRALAPAAAVPLSAGIDRVVHVAMATYTPSNPIKIRPRERYFADAGVAKIVVPATAIACAPAGASCAFLMEAGTTLDGFLIDGGGVSYGIVANANAERPVIRNTIVRQMARDGIIVFGGGARLGPNVHANDNAQCGMMIRAGAVSVDGTGNGFDDNRGGTTVNGVFVPGSGIHVMSGSLFVDNIATAKRNHIGVSFDAAGISANEQVLSQIDIMGNRAHGVFIGKDWSKVQFRKTNIYGNALAGIYVQYNASATNVIDLGSTALGNGGNNFGNATTKNTRAALFLCGSGATGSLPAEGNNWSFCPPTQVQAASCDVPAIYADVAYFPNATLGAVNPMVPPATCTSQ